MMEPLEVDAVEFYAKDNSRDHHTDCYDLISLREDPSPIFRRGFNFFFAVQFNRYYDETRDVVWVSFGFGPKPHTTKGTKVVLPLMVRERQTPRDLYRWFMTLHRHDGNTVTMQVHIPPNAQVGVWHCTIQTCIAGRFDRREEFKRRRKGRVHNERERENLVGTYKHPKGKRWVFGQFHEVILPACVFLLEKSELPYPDWNSPVLMTRAISQVINAGDNDGLLEGRWDGDYSDGISPHSWTGSVAIFDQYLRSGGRSVKYGQCWVFSAVAVTICRTLGIPCRSTTNYISAHDVTCSLSIDKYFDVFGNKIENGKEEEDDHDFPDMCWSFHSWNDVWMARPDLPPGYGGWQVIDATPQDDSNIAYRCGPASIEAIRRGEVGYLYDTPYMFASINADICHFQEDEESEWGFNRLTISDYKVGKKIITKKIDAEDDKGDSDMWDITREFKNPESTDAERLAVYNAVRGVPRVAHQTYEIPEEEEEDVEFDLIDTDAVPFGQNFDVIVNIYNNSNEVRNIDATISASTAYYTGVTANYIKRTTGKFSIRPREKEALKIHVSYVDYLNKLVDHGMIKIYAMASVRETNQTWSEEDDIMFKKPNLNIQTEQRFTIGQENQAEFSFRNPLNHCLTECVYSVEGPGLQKPKVSYYRDVQPNEVVEFSETFYPYRSGERKIVANFNCNEMEGVNGCTTVLVQ
ncbi:protein-glutamine gamma-glutamyltransferase [Holotrichia oblita]|uniref:Protein-glutamine gamma-glutamyltransferase n=1 Tax=Holotrichia oblita TaxID=644536 RepID=A0ACB9TBB6_HOLOL|nr:protein-glutamine gamma-glutamyltransferase [Holotrichia oblita]